MAALGLGDVPRPWRNRPCPSGLCCDALVAPDLHPEPWHPAWLLAASGVPLMVASSQKFTLRGRVWDSLTLIPNGALGD